MTPGLTLGTANFGLTYGIANKRMLTEKEAFAILEKAVELGVSSIDTARGYGDAEKILGTFFTQHGKVFEVVSKLPDGEYRTPDDVRRQVDASLESLHIDRIDALLLHSFRSFESFKNVLLPVFEHYFSSGLIGGYGLSVYHPYEVESALRAGFHITTVQFPLNLFDQRFLKGGYIEKFGASGISLYARSIFLQGLFFVESASLGDHFDRAKPKLKHLVNMARMHHTSVEALALLFAVSSGVGHVVLGVDTAGQLETNVSLIANGLAELLPRLKQGFDMLEIPDEDIILPFRWKQ
jgi:aryl-alcohol dehydrogenase-like predicted oxidoreductase